MEQEFNVLENKTIGRNFHNFRKIRDKKASEVAEFIGMTEATYTRYERGEGKITIELVQKVAEFLKVDPLQIIAHHPGNVVENSNSPNSPIAIYGHIQTTHEDQTKLLTKLIEAQLEMTNKQLEMTNKIMELMKKK